MMVVLGDSQQDFFDGLLTLDYTYNPIAERAETYRSEWQHFSFTFAEEAEVRLAFWVDEMSHDDGTTTMLIVDNLAVSAVVPTPSVYGGGALLFALVGIGHWWRKRRLTCC